MDKNLLLKARGLAPDVPFHLPPPASPIRSIVTLTLENAPAQPEIVLKDRRRDFTWQIQMAPTPTKNTYTAQVTLPLEPTVIYYHFKFPDGKILQEKRQEEGHNTPIYDEYKEQDFQIGVYDPNGMPPEWAQGMLIYQIFPDSFARGKDEITPPRYGPYGHDLLIKKWEDDPEAPPVGRDFYGGDLRGVIQKLDYLKELGVDCIYFCPIFASPTNHRYDANDYLKIDPMLATEEDFTELLEAAHARNIKIVLDAVYNHCSCDSIYFDLPGWHKEGAYQSKQSPYYRWFNFYEYPTLYQTWIGLNHMPEFVECPEVEEFFLGSDSVTAYWTRLGVDGWRTDVTSCNTDTFWRRFRKLLNELKPDNYSISEHWEDATHYMVGDMFSATMNYRFTWALVGFFADRGISTLQFEDRLATLRRDTPAPALKAQMNLLDSHDTRRMLTACREDKGLFKQIVAFQMAYPGAPMIYYGDEAGLTGDYAEDGRKAFPWGNEDQDLLQFYKHITAVRSRYPALRQGSIDTVLLDDIRRLHGFVRHMEGEKSVYAAFNGGNEPVGISLPLRDGDASGTWEDALGRVQNITLANGHLNFELPPQGMVWLAQK